MKKSHRVAHEKSEAWTVFVDAFDKLIQKNIGVVSLTAMNLPADWKAHLSV